MDFVDILREKAFLGREFLTWLWFKSERTGGRVELTGAAAFPVSVPFLTGELGGLFYHLEVEAGHTIMDTAEVEAAEGEETVLGLVLRDLRDRERNAGDDSQRTVVRRAVRHVWEAFRRGNEHG